MAGNFNIQIILSIIIAALLGYNITIYTKLEKKIESIERRTESIEISLDSITTRQKIEGTGKNASENYQEGPLSQIVPESLLLRSEHLEYIREWGINKMRGIKLLYR